MTHKQVTLEEQTRSYEYADTLHNKWIIVPSNNGHGTEPLYSIAPTSFILLILWSLVGAVFFLTNFISPLFRCRVSSVGTATCYGLDGGGEIFRTCPDRPWGPPSLVGNVQTVSLQGVKRPECFVDHPPLSITEVKE